MSYNAADQVTSSGFVYDANSNLRNDGTTSYLYDAANRLVQTVRGGVTTTYSYDGWGQLVRESSGGVTTDYVLDERGGLTRILAEVRSDGSEVLYAYGPEGFAAQRSIVSDTPQGVLYPLLDGLGSVRHLTDNTGTILLSRVYDAYGTVRQSTGSASTRLGYNGELTNADGTVNLRARTYQPSQGRLLQRDSFAGIPSDPQSLHRYLYARNNPLGYSDPSGHYAWEGCNLLPNRPDTCTWQDFQDWWASDDGDRAREFGSASTWS